MRYFLIFLFASLALAGGWFYFDGGMNALPERLHLKKSEIFQMRYSAETIMEQHKGELLKNEGSTFLEPTLALYPYLVMDVKFALNETQTREGTLVFGLTDGEMVIHADTWEKTHGFDDCLAHNLNELQFRLLQKISEAGGSIEKERLLPSFKGEEKSLTSAIESCIKKKLIVDCKKTLRLHFEHPHFQSLPETSLQDEIVLLPHSHATFIPRRYSPNAVQKLSLAAFAPHLSIRRTKTAFLPVYILTIQHKDGTLLSTYWNAVSGKRVTSHLTTWSGTP